MILPFTNQNLSNSASTITTTNTMNFHHASKTIKTLNCLRGKQEICKITPNNSKDDDDDNRSTFESSNDDKGITLTPVSGPQSEQHQSDLYTPLSPEEADEDQLAEFFTTLDFDVSFGSLPPPPLLSFDMDEVYQSQSVPETTKRHEMKRRRLSFSSYLSDEAGNFNFKYDETESDLQRKQSIPIEC